MAKMIASQYSGKCRTCKVAHGKGDTVSWQKGIKGVQCVKCANGTSPAVPAPPATPRKAKAATTGKVDRFGSWQEFVDLAVESRNPERMSTTAGSDFTGSDSWDDALNLAREGWTGIRPEVDALVEKMESVIAPSLQPAFTSVFDVVGGSVDVGRFLDGEPECMVETKLIEIARPGKVVSILVNGSFNAGTQETAIRERGAAVVALIDSLERLQHSTEVDVEITCKEGFTTVIRLKNAEDQLDIDLLMFAIAHPSALRRIYFAYMEGHSNPKFRALSDLSYGRSSQAIMGEELGSTVVLQTVLNMDAGKWIMEQLSEFGLLKEGE